MPEQAEKQMERGRFHVSRQFPHAPDTAIAIALAEDMLARPPAGTIPKTSGRIALYGAGNFGRMARDFLKAVWLDFECVIDRNADALRQDPAWQGVQLFRPDNVPDDVKREATLLVTVATAPYVPLEQSLAAQGFAHIVPFYDFAEGFRHLHPLSNGWFAGPLNGLDRRMVALVLSRLADDVSRAHFLQFLAWRYLREEWTFADAPVQGNNRFFIPEVKPHLRDGLNFIDGGAWQGNVSLEFDQLVGGRWDSITAVEPDETNRTTMERNFAAHWPDKSAKAPTILDCALGASNSAALFHSGLGYASQLSPTGRDMVEVRTIDSLALKADFIKLHLEGGELNALKGAIKTLQKNRPVIAATVYHDADGLWRTPLFLIETLREYRILFRLHSWCGTGAVLYGLPDGVRR
jgi:FkbM family methyltransferase